jgi:hypothetical protein
MTFANRFGGGQEENLILQLLQYIRMNKQI